MDGWMDEWMDGWMDGWSERVISKRDVGARKGFSY